MSERVAIVDEQDNIIGEASVRDVLDKALLHRSANIVVVNRAGQIFVHKRSAHLHLYPGKNDVKFGGMVDAGESYEQGARRELFEEAGVKDAKLTRLCDMAFRSERNNTNRRVFLCHHEGPFTLQKEEVESGRFMEKQEIDEYAKEGMLSASAENVWEGVKDML